MKRLELQQHTVVFATQLPATNTHDRQISQRRAGERVLTQTQAGILDQAPQEDRPFRKEAVAARGRDDSAYLTRTRISTHALRTEVICASVVVACSMTLLFTLARVPS